MASKTTFINEAPGGGQFAPEKGGQFAPDLGGQVRPERGGQFERIFQPKSLVCLYEVCWKLPSESCVTINVGDL
jgi:hypothetical protein